MTGTLAKLWRLFSRQEQRRSLWVASVMLVLALTETAGVVSVAPFLAVLGNPEVAQRHPLLKAAFELGGFSSSRDFLLALGATSFVALVFAAVVRGSTHYIILRFVDARRHSLSERLLTSHLRQPYTFFLGRNTAELAKGVLSEVDLVGHMVLSAMNIIVYGTTAAMLVGLLVVASPAVAAVAFLTVGGSYALIYLGVRPILTRTGQVRERANEERYRMAHEALGGIKEIKVLGQEQTYLDRFRTPSKQFSRAVAIGMAVGEVPRYLVELIGMGGVLAVALYLLARGGDVGGLLPILGIYALAAYRLLPASQKIYYSLSQLRFGNAALEAVSRDIASGADAPPVESSTGGHSLSHGIAFQDVSFRYPGSERWALENVSLFIPAFTTVGIVGSSGAGKTTAVDLLLGLLNPTTGTISIDGQDLDPTRLRAWQNSIGYVPQSIYLTDASIAANVALGVPTACIDRAAVERAARAAHLHDFVAQLPDGYDSIVGERGVRLSGGQRQRIGIARALYRDPALLVLDEATSALDTATEHAVMEAIAELTGTRTMVIIAHRLATVQGCSQLFLLENGRLMASGSLHQLATSNASFKRMLELDASGATGRA